MSDDDVPASPDPRFEALLHDFCLLSSEDQDLVMALVVRLRAPVEQQDYEPDVPFMDFDE